jgi:allantoate deiminase/N-carbamoyl-L-amino-acid hydrolase
VTLLTGSHYDTVRNGGKYDGREGILLPIAVVKHLHERGETLPFHFEVIGFSEEEGVRFKSTFLGSNAVTGHFDMKLLDLQDKDGISMREVITRLPRCRAIPHSARPGRHPGLWRCTSSRDRYCSIVICR